MTEQFKVRDDFGTLFVRDMDNNFLNLQEMDSLIARLIAIRNQMSENGVDQAAIQQATTDSYVAYLASHSKLHYPIEHDFLEYRPGKTRSPKQPRFSGVYFLGFKQQLDRIKIGVSNDIYKRTKGLWWEHKHKLAIVHAILETDEPYVMEAALHKRFADYHIEGEWFNTFPVMQWLESQV